MIILSFDIGIKNLAYAIIKYEPNKIVENTVEDKKYKILNQITLQEWHKIDLQCSKYDLDEISNNLLEVLDRIVYEELDDIHCDDLHVVIENQPALKSPTMKSIQIMIYTYFNTIKKYNNMSLKTKLISAKSKLKYINSFTEFATYINTINANSSNKTKKGYAKNKDDSIQFTNWLLRTINDNAHLEQLNNINKKDDVCDSFLQGMYYINTI